MPIVAYQRPADAGPGFVGIATDRLREERLPGDPRPVQSGQRARERNHASHRAC
ncbi:hypothetical protein J7E91_17700 [Streptomyces sp. ISL-99]|nr:hypothetical protein [Streptomyces sp. ISL-99]